MTAVTFPPTLGGSGRTYSDDNSPTTGLGNDGHRDRLIPLLQDTVAMAQTAKDKADAAQASANTAVNAPGTSATVASVTIPAATGGNVAFNLQQTGKAFSIGQTVVVALTASALNQFTGVITAFNAGTGAMTVNCQQFAGAGTGAATVSLTSPIDGSLTGRVTALEALQNKQEARARLFRKEFI